MARRQHEAAMGPVATAAPAEPKLVQIAPLSGAVNGSASNAAGKESAEPAADTPVDVDVPPQGLS